MKAEKEGYDIVTSVFFALTFVGLTLIVFPQIVVLLTSFNSTPELAFPPKGLSLKWYRHMIEREAFFHSVKLSLLLATLATVASLVISFLFSLAVVRHKFFGRDLINALILSPLIIPEVVSGLALLYIFNRLQLYNTTVNLLILHILLTLPYSVRVISATLYRFDVSLEEAALSLGADRLRTFALITVPLIRPGLISAAVFSFVVSFNNFTATMFIVTRQTTLPVEVFSYIRTENDPTVAAISSVFVILTILLILVNRKRIGARDLSGDRTARK